MSEARSHRPTITATWSKSSVISIEDALYMGKVKFSSAPTKQARGSGTYVYGNMNFDEALTLANLILNQQFTKTFPKDGTIGQGDRLEYIVGQYRKFGGSPSADNYGGRPESRIIEVTALVGTKTVPVQTGVADDGSAIYGQQIVMDPTKARWMISIKVGEGIKDDKGMIKPKDQSNMAKMTVFVSSWDMRRMMIMMDLHVREYLSRYFEDIYGPDGRYNTERRMDIFHSQYRSPSGGDEPTPGTVAPSEPEDFAGPSAPPAPPAPPAPTMVPPQTGIVDI